MLCFSVYAINSANNFGSIDFKSFSFSLLLSRNIRSESRTVIHFLCCTAFYKSTKVEINGKKITKKGRSAVFFMININSACTEK